MEDKTIVDGLDSIAPGEGVLSEEGEKLIPKTKLIGWLIRLMGQQILLQVYLTGLISSQVR